MKIITTLSVAIITYIASGAVANNYSQSNDRVLVVDWDSYTIPMRYVPTVLKLPVRLPLMRHVRCTSDCEKTVIV